MALFSTFVLPQLIVYDCLSQTPGLLFAQDGYPSCGNCLKHLYKARVSVFIMFLPVVSLTYLSARVCVRLCSHSP